MLSKNRHQAVRDRKDQAAPGGPIDKTLSNLPGKGYRPYPQGRDWGDERKPRNTREQQ